MVHYTCVGGRFGNFEVHQRYILIYSTEPFKVVEVQGFSRLNFEIMTSKKMKLKKTVLNIRNVRQSSAEQTIIEI